MSDVLTEQGLRDQYKIPLCYDGGPIEPDFKLPGVVALFFYMDDIITVYGDGTADRSWMGLDARCTGHYFAREAWPRKEA